MFIHSFVHSFIHSFTRSLVHKLTPGHRITERFPTPVTTKRADADFLPEGLRCAGAPPAASALCLWLTGRRLGGPGTVRGQPGCARPAGPSHQLCGWSPVPPAPWAVSISKGLPLTLSLTPGCSGHQDGAEYGHRRGWGAHVPPGSAPARAQDSATRQGSPSASRSCGHGDGVGHRISLAKQPRSLPSRPPFPRCQPLARHIFINISRPGSCGSVD